MAHSPSAQREKNAVSPDIVVAPEDDEDPQDEASKQRDEEENDEENSGLIAGLVDEALDEAFAPTPSIPYPGDLAVDQPPASGFEWRDKGPPGNPRGNWYNPSTKESLWYDPENPFHDPHWDYRVQGHNGKWRWYPDGRMEHVK